MKLKNFIKVAIPLLFILFFPAFAFSQVIPPCPPGCVSLIIPIDGGIGFLIVAGAVYGMKKIHSHRKK